MTDMVSTAKTAQEIADAAQVAGLHPTVQMILVLVGIMLALAYPVMLVVRTWQSNRNSAKKEEAVAEGDAATYTRMKEQIEQNAKDIRELVGEKNKWFAEATQLRADVSQLKNCSDTLEAVKAKLNEKDKIIQQKDAELASLIKRTLDMQERIHALEMRLAKDERMFCSSAEGCPNKTLAELPSTPE